MNWEPPLLVAHFGCLWPKIEHQTAQIGTHIFGEEEVEWGPFAVTAGDGDRGWIGVYQTSEKFFPQLGFHVGAALK